MTGRLGVISLLFLAANASAVDALDPPDQRLSTLRPEHRRLANPVPAARHYGAINAGHRILVAEFDTGIDYNHPELIPNLHFGLDNRGKPVSLGRDYLGQDNWASYRLAATDRYNVNTLSGSARDELSTRLKDGRTASFDIAQQGAAQCVAREMLKMDPRLSIYIDPFRSAALESDVGTHGTHVAGLITYDRPDIGLIPYRLLPAFHSVKDDKLNGTEVLLKQIEAFSNASDDAERKGARVINISINALYTKPTWRDGDPDGRDYILELEAYKKSVHQTVNAFNSVVRSHPRILFVLAAGNERAWTDNENKVDVFCSHKSANLLCVGALDGEGGLTSFTNVPINNVDLVFAGGQQVISTYPSDKCASIEAYADYLLRSHEVGPLCQKSKNGGAWTPDPKSVAYYDPIIRQKFADCQLPASRFLSMSGTSMAAPLVTHLAAEILLDEKMDLSPRELIQAIKNRANRDPHYSLPVYKLVLKRPSWYKRFGMRSSSSESAVFRAGTPNGKGKASCAAPVPAGSESAEQNDSFQFFIPGLGLDSAT